MRVAGKGNVSDGGGSSASAGDLYVVLQVQPPAPSESMFKRQGSDVTVEVGAPGDAPGGRPGVECG